MKMKTKLFAFLAVALMMALPLAAFVPSADADSDTIDSIDRIDGTADLQPIDLPEGFGDELENVYEINSIGTFEALPDVGSWGWDSTTGLGPFNSFYGAFDMEDGNSFVGVLDPYDLSKLIDGTPLDSGKLYNIMWVLPTIYWSVDENGDVTISNDSTKGTAYAHTVDGHVYNYMAIGVYHGDYRTLSGVTVLTSETGVAPEALHNRADFRDKANNYTMNSDLNVSEDNPAHSMLWNFYMWTAYKLCCYTVMQDFNSQAVVGNGNVNGGNYTKLTGGCDLLGPYAGNNGDLGSSGSNAATYGQDYAKLFIEEPWGTVRDFVDGVIIDSSTGYYLDSASVPTDSTSVGGTVELITATVPANNFGTEISTDPAIWGVPTVTSSSSSYYAKGTCDKYGGSGANYLLSVGGTSPTSASYSVDYGVSYGNVTALSYSGSYLGARLAFVFDAGPASNGGAAYTYTIDYDPTLMSTTSKAITVEGTFPISHNEPPVYYDVTVTAGEGGSIEGGSSVTVASGTAITVSDDMITIGSASFIALVGEPTAQYTYSFDSWELTDGSELPETVESDIAIRAVFLAEVNLYDVTIPSVESENGSLEGTVIYDVPYGTVIRISGNTLTIGETSVTAVPAEGYEAKWSVRNGSTVQGELEITVSFSVHESAESKLIKLIPLIVIIALTVMAAIALMSFTGNGIDLIKLLIGLTVCVLFVAMAMIPAVGGF